VTFEEIVSPRSTPTPAPVAAPVAPSAPVAAPVPEPEPALARVRAPETPAVTEDGLVVRRPGASIASNEQAQAVEAGQFRRLPTPGETRPDDLDSATRRRRMLSELSGGVDRGRIADTPDPSEEDPA
jgi:hypothetical protein